MMNDDDFSVGFEDSVGFELIGSVDETRTEPADLVQTPLKEVVEKKIEPAHAPVKSYKYSYKTVYNWFVKGKNPTTPFEQYLRTKPEVYLLFDLVPFQPLPNDILQTVEEFVLRCYQDIDKNLSSKNELIDIGDQIKACLSEIQLIYKYYDVDEFSFEKSLKHNLYSKLYVSLKEKEADGIIELTEIESILSLAKQLYLWDGETDSQKQEILNWIKDTTIADGCKIEKAKERFIKNVKNKPIIHRLNEYTCIYKLQFEYGLLKRNELALLNETTAEINDEALFQEAIDILTEANLLKDCVEAYVEDFFNIEKSRSKYDYSLKLPADYYQYLKTIATSTYLINEKQWEDFARKQNLSKLNDVSVAFILGTQKASSLETIATLLENNKSKAIERIIDGDIETYLTHVEQHTLAKQVEQAKVNFKNDKNTLLTSVVNILRGIKETETVDTFEVDDRQSLMALIERDAPLQEMVQYLLKRKTREKLNQRILSDSNDRNDLDEYLRKKNTSFVCLCLNYLREFPNESNASGYTNIYELYSDYVLNILIEKNAFNLFFSGYIHLIDYDLISQDLKNKINDTKVKMQKDFEDFCTIVNKKNKKKSFFGF